MEFRETLTMILYARRQKRYRYKEQIFDYMGEGEGGVI